MPTSQLTHCPYCGKATLVLITEPGRPDTIRHLCRSCNRTAPAPGAQTALPANPTLQERTIERCLQKGLLHGIKYYWDQKNRETEPQKYSLRLAKEEVEALLAARGLQHAVKKPRNNAGIIIIILLSIAVAIYFYFRNH